MTDYDDSNTEFCTECENTANISQHGVCSECRLYIYELQLGKKDLNNHGEQSKSPPIY